MEIRALLSSMWRSRTGPLLVAAQVALTLAVVVNVAYIVQQRMENSNRDTGIDIPNVFWVLVSAQDTDYNFAAAVQEDLAYLNALPGVIAASTSNGAPQTWYMMGLPFGTSQEQVLKQPSAVPGRVFFATEKYFDALGLKFTAGKPFDASMVSPPREDMSAALANWPAQVVVTQAMADKLYPQGGALGKTIWVGLVNRPSTIVGIVARMQGAPGSGKFADMQYQIVFTPMIPAGPGSFYLVRTQPGQRDAIMARVEKEIAGLQPGNRFVARIQALEKTAAQTRSGMRYSVIILSIVGVLVLAVTVIGIAGLAAFNVTTRTKQLGTRRAIGATKFHVLRYFIVENWIITTTGALAGCALALAAGMRLSAMFQMSRLPLYYLVGGVVGLWVLGLLAVLVPARRAASISPATATRMV
jgi:putative ABC transport system permease protein